jgi:hypothetical protein
MINISPKFSFNVTNHNPPWMDDEEDELLEARRRPRTPVPVPVPVAVPPDVWQVVTDMGFVQRYGEDICRTVIASLPNDLPLILNHLALYGARTDQLNRRLDDGTM